MLLNDNVVIIDTETTGLSRVNDEVLSIAIVDVDGNTLYHSLVKPTRRKTWKSAEKIHGITPADVADAFTVEELADDLAPFFADGMVIAGYNVSYDIGMLQASGLEIPTRQYIDVMYEYKRHNDAPKVCKLEEAANAEGYAFDAHDALNDAIATAYLFRLIDANGKMKVKTRKLDDPRGSATQSSSTYAYSVEVPSTRTYDAPPPVTVPVEQKPKIAANIVGIVLGALGVLGSFANATEVDTWYIALIIWGAVLGYNIYRLVKKRS